MELTQFDALDFDRLPRRIPTDRYTSREYAERERERIWMRVWQIAGRVDELPEPGDWKEYRILDQSFVIVRGNDEKIRGFANACRHRGNALCHGKGHSIRFTCPYHLWTYGLDGRLMAVSRPDLVGPIDKSEHGLLQVSVDCFAGFIFLNPDPHAAPLVEFLGAEVMDRLAPYHLEQMVPVGMDVRESISCNWKVVMDAFQEGYHIEGIHPELLSVLVIDSAKNRFGFFGDHSVAVAPFEVANVAGFGAEQQVAGMRKLPETFPGVAAVMPRFEELVGAYRNGDGTLNLPEGVTARRLLQQATRDTFSKNGFDVSGLTDDQMTDNQGWMLFPNFFMTVRAGECHVIMAVPHPDGDPNRCIWHVTSYMWLSPDLREQFRVKSTEVDEPGSFKYFLALQQDYEQMPRQQKGLRNRMLDHMSLAREEVCIANYHLVLDRYLEGEARS